MARATMGIGASSSGALPVSGTVDVQGIDYDASASLARPVVVGAKYLADPTQHTGSVDDEDTVTLRTDKLRNLMVSLATAIAGENIDANILEVGAVGDYYVVTSSGVHQVSTTSGVLLKLHYVTPVSGSNLTIYDATSSSGNVMVPKHETTEQEIPGNVPFTVNYGLKFTSGLLLDVTGSLSATLVYKENT